MHSALNKGSTLKGQSSSSIRGTYTVDKGISGNTHNYEIRDKETTTTTRRYLDHRTCFRCGHEWNIFRTESDEHTAHY